MPKIKIRDIAVVIDHDPEMDDAPVGEGPRRGDAPQERLNAVARTEMIQRQFESINTLMKLARIDHEQHCKKNETSERDLDYITRISTAEFSYYTAEPLTIKEFEELQNRIVAKANQIDKGIHLVLGSFAVLTEDQRVMNVTPHIVCGESPSVTLLVKNVTSSIDVRYKVLESPGNLRVLPKLDSSCFPSEPLSIIIDGKKVDFKLDNIIHCITPGETPFLTGIELCEDHTQGILKKNVQQLLASQAHLEQHPFSHMVVSNSVILESQHCLGTVMQVDPIFSRESCKTGVKQTCKGTLKQAFADASIRVYTIPAQSCLSLLEINQSVLSSLRDKAELGCNALSTCGFGPSDESILKLLTTLREKIATENSPQELESIIVKVKDILMQLMENVELLEVKSTIEELRKDLTRPGAEEKANRIETAAAKIPLEERFSYTFTSDELQLALASPLLLNEKEAPSAQDFKERFHQELGDHEKTKASNTDESSFKYK